MVTAPDDQRGPRYGAGLLEHQHPLELRRLRALEGFADPASRAALEHCGLRPGTRCLELGAGAGSVARWLAERCAPGEVVATDLDTSLLPRDVPNLTVLRHDVAQDDFPDGSFDLLHARSLLEHLPEREEVLARMVRWTAPGGRICVDGITVTPPRDAPDALRRCVTGLNDLAGGRMRTAVRWATDLPDLLARAGLGHIGLAYTPGLVGPGGNADAFLRLCLEQVGPAMVGQGLVRRQDLDAYLHLPPGDSRPAPVFLVVSAWGRRPRNRPRPGPPANPSPSARSSP